MKKIVVITVLTMVFSLFAICETVTETSKEINLGKVYFPKPFVHSGKDFARGVYRVLLISKEEIPYFKVSDKKGVLLFDEMAVVKPNKGKFKKFKYRVKREMLKGYEYFRIKVTKPDKLIMGYFLIKKKNKNPKKVQTEQAARKIDTEAGL